jgi:predicted Rossmann fold nucleotide-binding protein DprA/Smf involved in DNA uptake
MCIPSAWKQTIEQDRLLLLSPFEKKHRRMTAALAEQRNQFVASTADEVLFIHAAAGSQTGQFAQNCFQQGTHACAPDRPENRNG